MVCMIYTLTLNPAIDKTCEIPSFTPGALNRMRTMREDAAGKGVNVAKALDAMNEPCVAMGILGGETGRKIEQSLRERGIETDFIVVDMPTRVNLKVFDPVSGLTTEINEPGFPVHGEALSSVEKKLQSRLKEGDIAVFSGALPPGADASTYKRFTALCRSCGAKAFVDADGEPLRLAAEAAPYAIKPNLRELAAFLQRPLSGIDDYLLGARALLEKGTALAVVTMGSDGALFLCAEERLYAHGLTVAKKSTVGAGDAVMAALALCEARGMGLRETARLSMAAGAASVMREGSQSPDMDEVVALMHHVEIETL